jgi:adenine phosphoribosyltransferase
VTEGSGPADLAGLVAGLIRDVPDFPQPGILFRDIGPLLADAVAFGAVARAIADRHAGAADLVAGVEARGFLLAGAVGYAGRLGVVPVRKAGKLPAPTVAVSYQLEYGEATLELAATAFGGAAGRRVLVVDDVLATGGTLLAALDLVRRAGGEVAGVSVLIDLAALGGRARLAEHGYDVHAVLTL